MNIITAVDNHWAIGNRGDLLARIPGDHKHFREKTQGRVVVLGRKTLQTFPQGRPLKDRTNIILSRNRNFSVKDALVVHSAEELLEELEKYDTGDVYCIGGESVYRLLLPHCDTAYITKIDRVYEADTWFPDLDRDPEWELVEEGEEQTYFDIAYAFLRYERRKA